MKKVKLLDCTLRDGGFVNNWRFGKKNIINIIDRLNNANIDIIEVGYLRSEINYCEDESQFPSTEYISNIIPDTINDNTMLTAIVDYGMCDIKNIQLKEESLIDGIRLTFRKNQKDKAIEYCQKLKCLGYKVFVQPVSFMDYTYKEIIDLIEDVNALSPYAISIVDTYGFMNQSELLHRVAFMDDLLNENIWLGYHSHNNFQLAYSNSVAMLALQSKRSMIIDTSILGMGKGAGNTNTELLALHLNEVWDKNYDIEQIMEIADIYIEKERKVNSWGYSIKYYLAAANKCHYKYIDFLLKKKTLSMQGINDIISEIDENKRTLYEEKYISDLYRKYQGKMISSKENILLLKNKIGNKKILIMAPGKSISDSYDTIIRFIDEEKPYVISANFLPKQYPVDAVFISNNLRYSDVGYDVKKTQRNIDVIVSSNIYTTSLQADFTLNYSDLLSDEDLIADNSVLMLLKALKGAGESKVYIAGFDGYVDGRGNYYSESFDFRENNSLKEKNKMISLELKKIKDSLEIEFLTQTEYV